MADTVYTDTVTLLTADTMNDLDRLHYTILGDPATALAALANLIANGLGIPTTQPTRVPNIPIGAVAYGSLGTNAVHVAGTIYVSEIFIPFKKTITGLAVLNGATVGTDNLIVALYPAAGGAVLKNSALAGTLSAGPDAFQEIPFTSTYAALGGLYYAAVQCNGITAKTRRIAASTYLNLTKSFAGAFGTLGSLTVPVATAADAGPIVYAY